MYLREAWKALLAGKKIRYENADPENYIYMEDDGLYNNHRVRIGSFDVWTEYEEYIEIEYANFYKAMAHMVSGGRAKRKNWGRFIFVDKSICGKIIYNDSIRTFYQIEKRDIIATDWILF